jgi:hypothetical protein
MDYQNFLCIMTFSPVLEVLGVVHVVYAAVTLLIETPHICRLFVTLTKDDSCPAEGLVVYFQNWYLRPRAEDLTKEPFEK